MKKLTYEYVKQYFSDNGCELLEEEYINNGLKMKYRCSCGNISEISFNKFGMGRRCKNCGDKKRAAKKRLSYKYVYNYFEKYNCELLEKEYKNVNIIMKYICECGNKSKIRFSDFKKGVRCGKCSKTEKLTYEYVKSYFTDNNCELLEEAYVNCKVKMKYRCKCGEINEISFSRFQNGGRCKKCGYKKNSQKRKYNFEFIQNYFKNNNCELLEKEYKNNKTLMEYKCCCKNIGKVTFNNFQKGVRCQSCGILKVSGKNNANYNHNKTLEERLKERIYPEYRKWRKSIYKQNNYVCQKCHTIGGSLNAHHILNYSSNKDLRLDINNGITLCKKCHREFHQKYGKINNNKIQLKDFLAI